MTEISRILVLENGSEKQGLPFNVKKTIQKDGGRSHKAWFDFGIDIRTTPKESIAEFAAQTPDTLILSQPSFVGWDNSFDDKLHLFKKLKDLNIKLTVAVIYQPNFYWFVIKWLSDLSDMKKKYREASKTLLKECLEFHNIHYILPYDACNQKKSLADCMIPLTWEYLVQNYYEKGDKIKINATGKVKTVQWMWISSDTPESSTVHFNKGEAGFHEFTRFVKKQE